MGNSKAHKRKERNKGRKLDKESKIYFINQLKEARLEALRDAEGYQKVLHVIERIGSYLIGDIDTLGKYEDAINELAAKSPYAKEIPEKRPAWHTPFNKLYVLVRHARNDAMHQGVVARHLTRNLVLMALVLEDAMKVNDNGTGITDIMVRNIATAELWHPVSFVRQQMLINSFTYLPLFDGSEWKVISDHAVARYLSNCSNSERKKRLIQTIAQAKSNGLSLDDGLVVRLVNGSDTKHANLINIDGEPVELSNLVNQSKGSPILVTAEDNKRLVGLITPFDML